MADVSSSLQRNIGSVVSIVASTAQAVDGGSILQVHQVEAPRRVVSAAGGVQCRVSLESGCHELAFEGNQFGQGFFIGCQ